MLPEAALAIEHLGADDGFAGAFRFLRKCIQSDLVILNVGERHLRLACLLKYALPFLKFKIISADLILRTPRTFQARVKAALNKFLWKRVDRFVLYFTDLRGYERYFGISPDRVTYVPFKVNGWEKVTTWPADPQDGSYVLCAGRTLRDVNTFVQAVGKAGCPGVLLQQSRELLTAHGTEPWQRELPPNVKLVTDNTTTPETFFDFISKARIVVLPRFKHDIAASGIGTYIVAMALKRCVIISEGPAANDVMTDQAVFVPPENVEKLADQIKLLWHDDALRSKIAARGQAYALSLKDERRLLTDILRVSVSHLEA